MVWRVAYASIQPDENLLLRVRVRRREEPEIQEIAIRFRRHRDLTGVTLTNIKVDIGNPGPVYRKLYAAGTQSAPHP